MERGWFDQEAIDSERFDADIEQAELERVGRQMAKVAGKPGLCKHGWTGPDDSKKDGTFKCYHNCGKTWPNMSARDNDPNS